MLSLKYAHASLVHIHKYKVNRNLYLEISVTVYNTHLFWFFIAFIKSDRPSKYKNLQIKYVRGLDPIIKLLDADNKVEDILDIHKWDTDSVDEFLATHLSMD